jgi:hypothetical protein
MKITKVSPLSGKENTLDLPVTEEQLLRWKMGDLIQDVMPDLTPDEREFLISGVAPGEFDLLFGEEE